jgi:predicted nuclease of predicted toxin-antitoxin system
VRFLADECVSRLVVEAIGSLGYTVGWIHDLFPSATDEEVLRYAAAGQFILITADRDFGDLIFHYRQPAYGAVRILVWRFKGSKAEIAAEVASRLSELGESLVGQFTTVEPDRTRQRALPVKSGG